MFSLLHNRAERRANVPLHQSKSRERVSSMLKSAASKVMWVGRATVFAVGLAVILTLLFVVASMVLGVGGKPSISGEPGETNRSTWLVQSDAREERVLEVEPVARRRAPQGYAHVNVDGTFDPSRSKGVNDVTTDAGGPAGTAST
jgi:hypothetical protein